MSNIFKKVISYFKKNNPMTKEDMPIGFENAPHHIQSLWKNHFISSSKLEELLRLPTKDMYLTLHSEGFISEFEIPPVYLRNDATELSSKMNTNLKSKPAYYHDADSILKTLYNKGKLDERTLKKYSKLNKNSMYRLLFNKNYITFDQIPKEFRDKNMLPNGYETASTHS